MNTNHLKWIKRVSLIAVFAFALTAFYSFQSNTSESSYLASTDYTEMNISDNADEGVIPSDKCGSGEQKSTTKTSSSTSKTSKTAQTSTAPTPPTKSATKSAKKNQTKECGSPCKSSCGKSK